MSRCLRIFRAYSIKITRRNSTVFLILSFLLILFSILRLYKYNHSVHPNTLPHNNYDEYRPGDFLKGHQPLLNSSYFCKFNYGLPQMLDWGTFPIYTSPGEGIDGPYRVIYNAVKGTAYLNYSKYNAVTYATQATTEFIYHIVEIARYWEGPVSLAVYVPNYDMDTAMQQIKQLCRCYQSMNKVSIHLFYPKRHRPKIQNRKTEMPTEVSLLNINISQSQSLDSKIQKYRSLNKENRGKYVEWVIKNKIKRLIAKLPRKDKYAPILDFPDCAGPEEFNIPTFRREHSMTYPINVGRNVARNASSTNYFLVSDIEMVPSEGLATKFLRMLRKLMGDRRRDKGDIFAKTVFVVPLFEVAKGEAIPRDKDTLVKLVSSNRAFYFHQRQCPHCQRFPGLQTWLFRTPRDVLEPMLISRREYPYHRWEPLYFGTQQEPWYDEKLSWEGRQEKMTQDHLATTYLCATAPVHEHDTCINHCLPRP
ncbi:beta-1,4-glucuronyltransferase 1-like isoform X2 [Leptidea sinapis]|uniref:beta-1,4-glucuronyltransferase 1-like isoform X2 n=1 Tax=Leptidea sinapis TaxID=189913 RepID=UPI0021C28408|nr:beta-1,4-glucuronyltransferase 1-like isoform X2 [Leptidea sinapis]